MKTRILGIVLLVVALGVAAWLITGLLESDGSKAGYVLGLCLFSLPFFAVGLYLLLTSRGEIKTESRMDQQRTILNAVMTRGRVSVADLAIECNASRDQVKQYIYDLIGKDLFRGYVNWEKGELVSAEAAQMKEGTCPNCGGKLELAGKGLVRCPYCGTEIYLSALTVSTAAPVAPAAPYAAPPPEPPPAEGQGGDWPAPGQGQGGAQ
jgi:hypothetical protein